MTSLGKTYERLVEFIRFFVNRAPDLSLSLARCIHYTFALFLPRDAL